MKWQVLCIIQSLLTLIFVVLAMDDIVNEKNDNVDYATFIGAVLVGLSIFSIIMTGLGV